MSRVRVLIVVAVLTNVTYAIAEETQLPHITVTGTATTEVVPDLMNWSLSVRTKRPQISDAAESHTIVVESVLKFLKASEIEEPDIQTSNMSFGENWEYRNSSQVLEGYIAQTDISFKSKKLDSYRALWIGLAAIRDVRVSSVAYDHSKRIDHQNETRRKALRAAREKARDLASTLDSEIGEPLAIEEDLSINDWWRPNPMSNTLNVSNASGNASGDEPVLAPGRIPVRTRVKVIFRLISPRG